MSVFLFGSLAKTSLWIHTDVNCSRCTNQKNTGGGRFNTCNWQYTQENHMNMNRNTEYHIHYWSKLVETWPLEGSLSKMVYVRGIQKKSHIPVCKISIGYHKHKLFSPSLIIYWIKAPSDSYTFYTPFLISPQIYIYCGNNSNFPFTLCMVFYETQYNRSSFWPLLLCREWVRLLF